ncbi:hypothetical protein BC936DRAFT_148301 [Jimgerdemannia flammicorona]|uniref:Uncharacterized protein n=1 Tax=Jimgerdemannia flammicorona TaxID=994334 RepID=A0A433D3A9_9FUNG|nr:hypothetical protein BC936DRAFT_148301 [Jimgerdemannia flammicorona]
MERSTFAFLLQLTSILRPNDPNMTLGSTLTVIIALVLVTTAASATNIANIVLSARLLSVFPDVEPCASGNRLRIFVIGGIVSSAVTLLGATNTCLFTVLVWFLTRDYLHGGLFVAMTGCNGLLSFFQVAWAILAGAVMLLHDIGTHSSDEICLFFVPMVRPPPHPKVPSGDPKHHPAKRNTRLSTTQPGSPSPLFGPVLLSALFRFSLQSTPSLESDKVPGTEDMVDSAAGSYPPRLVNRFLKEEAEGEVRVMTKGFEIIQRQLVEHIRAAPNVRILSDQSSAAPITGFGINPQIRSQYPLTLVAVNDRDILAVG